MAIDDPMPMTTKRNKPRAPLVAVVLIATAICLAMAIRGADAYVLEGPHLLDLTAKALGRIAALQVTQKRIVLPATPEAEPTLFDETAIYVMPERFRSDIVSESIRRTHLVFADGALTVTDGRITEGESPLDLYQRLLRSRSRSRLMRTLSRLGVETAISSLGRFDETLVYVIGAHYPDEAISQLAVDKETFLPVRLLLVDANAPADQGRLEVVFSRWQKIQNGWFPYQINFTVDDRPTQQIQVTDVQINPSIPADRMDPEALRASVAARTDATARQKKQETVQEIQKAVNDFQKKFE